MKKISTIYLLGLVMLGACSKSDDKNDPNGGTGGNNSGTEIRGTITSDLHWTKDKTYRLRGYVYVQTGVTLTIDPGTKIVSNKDSAGVLVIYRGAKIMAQGTAAEPIVFTSNETSPAPGDLGGVVLVGQATGNGNHSVIEGGVDAAFSAFGGTNDADNSGIMKYVRIEYAGKAVNPGDEVNGLSLYGVGSGTTLDYIQVVRGLDDAFEFFGGTVNAKHLIAYNSADDDFDMDDGYRGKIQFAISIKDPKFTDAKGTTGDVSNNFEVDNVNPSNGFLLTRTPITSPVLSNFTAIGPNNASGVSSDYGWGMRWRRGTKFILANSIVIGSQKGGFRLQEDSTIAYFARGISGFYNSFLQAYQNTVDVETGKTIPGVTYDASTITAQLTGSNKTTIFTAGTTGNTDMKLTDPFNNTAPNVKPATGSPALSGALFDFSTSLGDAWFDKVAYRGAMDGTTDWTASWTVWNK
ncbi:hypothetical protein A3860_03865 [Niastella vici]|uniref:T9SS C-terminal target domain-containing protein n=1 Tax=Niastella vici TaxID=1703345 RepID=A0A1V9FR94_9BACT|nr:hypothetical protein [Niastella vici]OQP60874.1 hypothetical protein A3860_03865 [Niastella vici]